MIRPLRAETQQAFTVNHSLPEVEVWDSLEVAVSVALLAVEDPGEEGLGDFSPNPGDMESL
jgi:hypothetical protein